MIAMALGLISLVVMIATGVVASSDSEDHLTFLGVGVHTTTAQVFVTGAIFGWLFLVALWLLRIGVHRSGDRCAELAARRGRRPGAWFGFGDLEDAELWGGWEDWAGPGDKAGAGFHDRSTEADSVRFRSAATDAIVGGTGAASHGGGTPWRPDAGFHRAHRAVAATAEQAGMLSADHSPGPVAGRFPVIGVDRGAQRGQIGGGSGPVAGEDRRPEGERSGGDGGQ
jgi:hypothetical protein